MKTRLKTKIGDDSNEIWAGTFHSVCVKILRRFGDRIGYDKSFNIYDTEDQKKIVTQVIKDLEMDDKMFPPKTALSFISTHKNHLNDPDEARKEASNFREEKLCNIYEKYQSRLKEANALDFDDLIMQTVHLLRTDSEACEYLQNKFKYVCVDEYQDTNHAQFVLTDIISRKNRNLMVVGDDDQSIYKFRGADIENILNFDKVIKDTKTIKLEQNYRSTKNILDAANSIIANNTKRHGKTLWTAKEDGTAPVLRCLPNQQDEAGFIAETISSLKISGKYSLNNIAILYRANALSNNIESALSRRGIPYRVLSGLRFYERKEIKDIMAYLSLINNQTDNLRLERIINEPKRKIGESTVSAVKDLSNYLSIPMFEIMKNADEYPALAKSATKLKDFTNLILGLKDLSEATELDEFIDKVLDLTGYRAMLKNIGDEESNSRLENINELISNAVAFMESHDENEISLASFLEETALIAEIDNYDADSEAVVLMTIHSAKGLEFPVVFLPGLEENIFPSYLSTHSDAEIEEERRLAYVAVTRAKEKLYLTHAKERLLYGKTDYNKLSRFIRDILPLNILDSLQPASQNSNFEPVNQAKKEYIPIKKQKPSVSYEMLKTPFSSAPNTSKPTSVGNDKFNVGDLVDHPMFKTGMIISCTKMGADYLYEISFDTVGTKKMMGTYAKLKKHE